MNKKKLPYKKVRIIWQDICSSSQWYDDLTDVDKFSYSWCEDVGYLYYKDSKKLIFNTIGMKRKEKQKLKAIFEEIQHRL